MEQMNRIELRGNVGNIRIASVGDSKVANFSLATNYVYKTRDGQAVVETTWFNVVAWDGKYMPELELITKGAPVTVIGRVRSVHFTGQDGIERNSFEVIASKITLEPMSEE